MDRIKEMKRHFKSFLYERYATDVTFPKSYHPSDFIKEGNVFSGKNKFYGNKTEVSVLPIEIPLKVPKKS